MNRFSLTHVPDPALLRGLKADLDQERTSTASFLAHLAEVDARRLYAPAGYPSLFAWCVEVLHLSEDAAAKRIQAARAARRFPALFPLVADGRLHLAAVVMLAPHLTPDNADRLLAEATHQSKAGIERLLAEWFPRPDLPVRIEALVPRSEHAPGHVGSSETEHAPGHVGGPELTLEAPGPAAGEHAPGHVERAGLRRDSESDPPARARVTQLAPGRFGVQFTLDQAAYQTLCEVQALLGHAVPSGDVATVVQRALACYKTHLERRKFAATGRPRGRHGCGSANPRYVPADVRRAVWQRDGGQCTFVSDAGHRCPARTRLEFDHAEAVARGGRATARNLRLRCRAHNQYAAECAFGSDFMSRKREAAQRDQEAAHRRAAAEEARALAAAAAEEARALAAAAAEQARVRAAAAAEVVPWLRALGLRLDEARRAAERCEAMPDATLEERVRCVLSGLGGPVRRHAAPAP